MYARLDRLIVKLFRAEESLDLHLLIDTSKSMAIGNPSKLDYALCAAAALAYVALARHERVSIGLFDGTLHSRIAPTSGKKQFITLLKRLAGTHPEGTTDFKSSLSTYASRNRKPGLAILISDLFEAGENYQLGISALRQRRFEVKVLHVLAQEELAPTVGGPLKLVDIETDQVRQIFADKRAIASYSANLARFCKDIENFCSQHGIAYWQASTATHFEELLFQRLRERRFLQ